MIDIACPQCQKKMRVRDELAGKRARCPHCQAVLDVPAAQAAAPIAPAAPPPAPPAFNPEAAFDTPATFDAPANFDATPAYHAPAADPGGFSLANEELAPDARVPCPACQEMIVHSAVKCRFCGEVLDRAKDQNGWTMLTAGIIWILFGCCSLLGVPGTFLEARGEFGIFLPLFLLVLGLGWTGGGTLAVMKKMNGVYIGLVLGYMTVVALIFQSAPPGVPQGAFILIKVFRILIVVGATVMGHVALAIYRPARK